MAAASGGSGGSGTTAAGSGVSPVGSVPSPAGVAPTAVAGGGQQPPSPLLIPQYGTGAAMITATTGAYIVAYIGVLWCNVASMLFNVDLLHSCGVFSVWHHLHSVSHDEGSLFCVACLE